MQHSSKTAPPASIINCTPLSKNLAPFLVSSLPTSLSPQKFSCSGHSVAYLLFLDCSRFSCLQAYPECSSISDEAYSFFKSSSIMFSSKLSITLELSLVFQRPFCICHSIFINYILILLQNPGRQGIGLKLLALFPVPSIVPMLKQFLFDGFNTAPMNSGNL